MKYLLTAILFLSVALPAVAQPGTPNRPDITVSEPTAQGALATSFAGTSTLAAGVFQVKSTGGNLYAVTYNNAQASVCYIQLFDALAANVTLNSTVPNQWIPMAASSTFTVTLSPIAMMGFATALSAASTTTPTGATPCGTVTLAGFRFK